jgi:hypothetical protein
VTQNVAYPTNLFPWNRGSKGCQILRDVPGSFGNDFDPALDAMSKQRVAIEVIQSLACGGSSDAVQGLYDFG